MKTLTLPDDHAERIKVLNANGIRPYQIEDGDVELEGYELSFEPHPADDSVNVWQLFKDDELVALWEMEFWS